MSIGTHRVTIGPAGADLSCDVLWATIRHGRGDPTSQAEASSATLELPFALPAGLDVGSPITVDTQHPTAGWLRRFTGTITDLITTWEGDDVHPISTVTAVGPLAGLGRRVVGDVPWPQELDGARAGRILTAAGLPTSLVDPGTVQMLPRDVDARDALDLLSGVATDAAGLLWETRDGNVAYADAVHRHAAPQAVEFGACDVLLAPTWSRTIAGLVNAVTIRYGPTPEGGEQPSYSTSNEPSIGSFGRFAYSASTELAALADAQARAQLLIVRGGMPAWNMPDLPIDLEHLDVARTAAVLGLDVGSLIALTGLPAGSPSTTVSLWVEGWTERLGYGIHDLVLAVSAYCRTAPPPTWDEVPPGWTWDTIGGVLIRRNLVANPRIGVDLNAWWEYGGVNTRLAGQEGTGWGLGTSTCLRSTFQDAAAVPTYSTGAYTNLFPVTEAKQYAGQLQVRSNRPQRVAMSVEFYDNGTDWNYLGATWDQPDYAPAVMLTPNVPATLVSKPYYAPIGATVALIGWYPSPNNTGDGGPSIVAWNDGDWAEVTNAHLEETTHELTVSSDPVTGIFHGGLPDTATEDFAWDGAADASASTRTTKRTIVRENMFINPRAVTDNAWGFWPGSNGAGTFSSPVGQAGWAFGTTTAFRCTWTKSADPNASGGIYTAYAGPVTPGLRYAVALQIRTSKPQRMILDLEFHDAADAWVAGSGAPHILDVPANTVITLSVLSANGAPPTATKMNITCYSWQQGGGNYSDWAPGDWLEGTNMQFEQTDQALTASGDPVTGMFSGATPDTLAADYAWVGAPNASHSRRTSPPPLTWDGSTCLGPLPSSGRWVDVPASTRWDELAAGTTWDTWH